MPKEKIENIKVHLANQFNLPKDQIDILIPSFISTLGEHLLKLEEALQENNPILLGRSGHTLKGACLNLGLEDCAKIALQIEQKGKAGDLSEDYKALLEDLRGRIAPLLK